MFDRLLLDLRFGHASQEGLELLDAAKRRRELELSFLELLDPGHPLDFHQVCVEPTLFTDPAHAGVEAEGPLGTEHEDARDEAVLTGLDHGEIEALEDRHRSCSTGSVFREVGHLLIERAEIRLIHQAPEHGSLNRGVEMLAFAGSISGVQGHQHVGRGLTRAEVRGLGEADG